MLHILLQNTANLLNHHNNRKYMAMDDLNCNFLFFDKWKGTSEAAKGEELGIDLIVWWIHRYYQTIIIFAG